MTPTQPAADGDLAVESLEEGSSPLLSPSSESGQSPAHAGGAPPVQVHHRARHNSADTKAAAAFSSSSSSSSPLHARAQPPHERPATAAQIAGDLALPAACFAGALLLLYLIAANPPPLAPGSGAAPFALSAPRSVDDVRAAYRQLEAYRDGGGLAWLVSLFAVAYLTKQTFSIPGSALLNALAGALFGLAGGLALVVSLTAAGCSCCYWMSYASLRRAAAVLAGSRVRGLRETMTRHADNLFFFLLFSRLFPASPNWALNLVSPIVGVPYPQFVASVTLGLLPYCFVTVNAGLMLGTLSSMDEIFDAATLLRLAALAFVALLPALCKGRLQRALGAL